MSRGRKRGRARQIQEGPLAALQALKPGDKNRPAVVAAVLAKLNAGEFSDVERYAASSLLGPRDWLLAPAPAPLGGAVTRKLSRIPPGATLPATICGREFTNIRRTATLDGLGIRWTNDEVRVRLIRVMDTLRRTRFPAKEVPSTKVAAGFDIVRTKQELWDLLRSVEPPPERPAAPTPGELQEMDDTLPWLFAVADWRHRLAASLRASTTRDGKQTSWRAVAAKLSEELHRMGGKGVDHKTAQRWEGKAIEEIVEALSSNGRKVA